MPHVWSMQEAEGSRQLEHYRTKMTIWPVSYLTIGTHDWYESRDQVARMPCFAENWLCTFLMYTIINTLISMKYRELLERILREKPYRKTRLTHPQSLSFDSLNSSTLTLSIDISLRGKFAKSLSHHTHISEEVFWCLGRSSEMTNSFGWCNGLIAGSRNLKKTRLGITLLEQEAWRA